MKGFMAGIIVGGLAVALWVHFSASSDGPDINQHAASDPSSEGISAAASELQPALDPNWALTEHPLRQEQLASAAASEGAPAALAPTTTLSLTERDRMIGLTQDLKRRADSMPERDAQAMCSYISLSRQEREEAKLRAEPKDESWAHPMEQLISQYIGDSLKGQALDELTVECRTTHCDISARGQMQGGATRAAFSAATQAIRDQSWSDFSGFSGGGGGSDGVRWNAHSRVLRGDEMTMRAIRSIRDAQRAREGRE